MKDDEKRVIFLKGKKVILRPLNKETDLENAVRWFNDPEVVVFIAKMHLPVTVQEEAEWLDNLKNRKDDVLLAIETIDGVHMGSVGLHKINWVDRTAEAGMAIGKKSYWGRGYGTDAAMLVFSYAFNDLNLRKLNIRTFSFNERALGQLMKCGCKKEGVQKQQVFKNGKYRDIILFSLFKKDWQMAWKKYQEKTTTSL